MKRSIISILGVLILLTAFLASATPVAAARIIHSVTLDGGSSVTVCSGATITVAMTVEGTGGGSDNDWESSGWYIGTSAPGDGDYNCVDTPNHTYGGTNTESFTITAPATPGTYDAYFRAYRDGGCSGDPDTYTMTDAVTVIDCTCTGWVSPEDDTDSGVQDEGNAYADGGGYANFNDNGDNATYFDYDFSSIPSGATIQEITVRLDVTRTDGGYQDRGELDVQLSWNDGGSWTSAQGTGNISRTPTWDEITLSGFSGHTWTRDEVVNHFRVRATADTYRSDVYLDWIPVRVCYTEDACTDDDSDGWTTCDGDCDDGNPDINPGEDDVCNGIDDDCNPGTPDGSDEAWDGDPCDGPDSDLCQEGTYSCSGGSQVCSDDTGDDLELCDGQDNDCNPSTPDGSDEGWLGVPCDGNDSDLCEEGEFICDGGSQVCTDDTGDDLDLCNGSTDDDCNPSTPDGSDEPWYGQACDGPDSDLCEEGQWICNPGSQVCTDDTGDDIEVCNDYDDDCDGLVDNNDPEFVDVQVQLAIVLDGSVSFQNNFPAAREAVASAVENGNCFPHDGTLELTVIQFAEALPGGSVIEIPPVVLTAANASTVANQIRNINAAGGYTPLSCGVYRAAQALMSSPCGYDPEKWQIINIITDGAPNRCCEPTPTVNNCGGMCFGAEACIFAMWDAWTAKEFVVDQLGPMTLKILVETTENPDWFVAGGILWDDFVYPPLGVITSGLPLPSPNGWVYDITDWATELPPILCEKILIPECEVDADCDDGLYCNGDETCVDGQCQPGTAPDCDDGVGCTDDSCNEDTDSCDNIPNDANCDDGDWCNGDETCHPINDCQPGTPVDCSELDDDCNEGVCDEDSDSCTTQPTNEGGECDDGQFCTDPDTCNNGTCTGPPRDCTDADECTDDSCDEDNDRCVNEFNPELPGCECPECYHSETQVIVSEESADTTYVIQANTGIPTPYPAVRAWEPAPYPTTYPPEPPETTGSTWDTQVGWFEANAPSADWIWEANRPVNPDSGDVVIFQNTVNIPAGATDITGTIHITCDNGYEVWLDGTTLIGSAQVTDGIVTWQLSDLTQPYVDTSNWQSVEHWPITGLHPGANVFTFECANEYMGPLDGQDVGTQDTNPAGLIFQIEISYCAPNCEGTVESCGCNEPCQNCNDGNVCTTDSCDAGVCVNTPNTDPCNDGDPCTVDDTCDGQGNCVGTPMDCDDDNPCTDDSCVAGACVNTNNTDPCDDGDPCTTDDTCAEGTCTGTPLECPDCYECDSQVIISDDSQETTYVTLTNTGNPTPYPAVLAWVHSSWNPSLNYDFSGSGAQWIWESFNPVDPVNGDVVYFENTVTIPAGATNLAGTVYVTCDNGYELYLNTNSVGSAQLGVGWGPGNLTEPFCNTSGWESVESYDVSTWLTTGANVFEFRCANEQMDGGTSSSNPAGLIFEITITYCVPLCTGCESCENNECVDDDANCDDGQWCNGDETCENAVCQPGTPPNCDDGATCTTDSCDEANDECDHDPIPGFCDDSNVCTDDACNPEDPSSDPTTGCVYTNNTDPCDDGLFCTVDDVCAEGACGGSPRDCSDEFDCTTDTCDEVNDECDHDPVDAICDDGDVCTDDVCNPETGCEYTYNEDPCDDGDICTVDDVCYEGACGGGPAVIADAGPDVDMLLFGVPETIGGSPTEDGSVNGPFTFSWNPTTGLDNPNIANPTFTPAAAGTYTFTVTVTNDDECTDTDSMIVRVTQAAGAAALIPDRCFMIVDMLGERTLIEMNCCENTTMEEGEAYDEQQIHLLALEEDTLVQCGDYCEEYDCNCYPKIIVMSPSDESPDPPEGMAVVGPIYDFTGYEDVRQELACHLVTYFDPVASVLLHYDTALLPEGAANPVIAFYSHELGQWVILPPDTGVVAEPGMATGLAEYFASPFAVLVDVNPPAANPENPSPTPDPAHFVASGLSITPAEAEAGETVTISLNVTNDGDLAGNYVVELTINGSLIDSQAVTLGGGQSEAVSFTVSASTAGTYEVTVSTLSGSFTVVGSSLWWIYLIIAAVVIIAGILIWRFARKSPKAA